MQKKLAKDRSKESQNLDVLVKKEHSKKKKRRVVLSDSDEEVNFQGSDDCSKSKKERERSKWVQCDNPECKKWRRIDYISDITDLSKEQWICDMNENKEKASCVASQETLVSDDDDDHGDNGDDDNDDECNTGHFPGMLVWGKIPGYPWWPGIVDDDPDLDTYFWNETSSIKDEIKTSIHVTFFGSECTRAWLYMQSIRQFSTDDCISQMGAMVFRGKSFKLDVEKALKDAKDCVKLSFKERLAKFCFKVRFNGQEYTGNPNIEEGMEIDVEDGRRHNRSSSSLEEDEDASEQKGMKEKELEAARVKVEDKINISPAKQPTLKKAEKPNKARKKKFENIKSKVVSGKRKSNSKGKGKIDTTLAVNENVGTKTFQNQKAKKSRTQKDGESSMAIKETPLKSKEEEFRQKCKSWQLTREESTVIPTLIKLTRNPIDEKEISVMAEKMMKEVKGEENQINQQSKKTGICDSSMKKKLTANTSKKQTKDRVLKNNNNKGQKKSGSKTQSKSEIQSDQSDKSNDIDETKSNRDKESKNKFEEAKHHDQLQNSIEVTGGIMSLSDDEAPQHRSYDGANDTPLHHIEGRSILTTKKESAEKIQKESAEKTQKESREKAQKESAEKTQKESREKAQISLKAKRSAFSVPIKHKIRGDASTNQPTSTMHDKKSSIAASKRSAKVGNSKSGKSGVKPTKGISGKIQKFQCQFNETDYESIDCKVEDSFHQDYINSDMIKMETHYNSSQGDLPEFYPSSVGEKDSFHNPESNNFKCEDGADQSLDEIISFHEASEIISDSFPVELPKTKQNVMNKNRNKLTSLSAKRQASPLVPINVAENMELSGLFKSVPVECESLNGADNRMSEEYDEMDQVTPAIRKFDQDSEDSSEF